MTSASTARVVGQRLARGRAPVDAGARARRSPACARAPRVDAGDARHHDVARARRRRRRGSGPPACRPACRRRGRRATSPQPSRVARARASTACISAGVEQPVERAAPGSARARPRSARRRAPRSGRRCAASRGECVTSMRVRPRIRRSGPRAPGPRCRASSAVVGSSRMMIGGLRSSVRAMPIRWRWPPDRPTPCGPSSVS